VLLGCGKKNATVRGLTHGQTHRQTDRQTQTDFIICPIAICYSYGADNNTVQYMSSNNILKIKLCVVVEPASDGSVRLWAL